MKLRASFVHVHWTAVKHRSVECRNSALGFRRVRHLHEGYAAGFARIPVFDDHDRFDGTMGRKQFPQLLLCHRDMQVSDKDVSHEFILFLTFRNLAIRNERGISKGDLDVDRLSQGRALREAVRFQLASPWGPS